MLRLRVVSLRLDGGCVGQLHPRLFYVVDKNEGQGRLW